VTKSQPAAGGINIAVTDLTNAEIFTEINLHEPTYDVSPIREDMIRSLVHLREQSARLTAQLKGHDVTDAELEGMNNTAKRLRLHRIHETERKREELPQGALYHLKRTKDSLKNIVLDIEAKETPSRGHVHRWIKQLETARKHLLIICDHQWGPVQNKKHKQ